MARIGLDPRTYRPAPSLLSRALLAASRRVLKIDAQPAAAMAHHQGVFLPWSLLEVTTRATRSVLPAQLGQLAVFVTSVQLGCTWCIDYSAALWEQQGLAPQILRQAARWREHPDTFDEVHRLAFEYCEAVTSTPPAVTDELSARLAELLGEDGLVELTYWIALENMRSRFNSALGLASQGFSTTACEIVPA